MPAGHLSATARSLCVELSPILPVHPLGTCNNSRQHADAPLVSSLPPYTHTHNPQGRVYALPDVWVRPAFAGKGRKVTGTLEAHGNGFRYTSPKGDELDIMYR